MPNSFKVGLVFRWGAFSVISAIAIVLLVGLPAHAAGSGCVTLEWDLSTDPEVVGYVVEYGQSPGGYLSQQDADNVIMFPVWNLEVDQTYYFSVRSYTASVTVHRRSLGTGRTGAGAARAGAVEDAELPPAARSRAATRWMRPGVVPCRDRSISIEMARTSRVSNGATPSTDRMQPTRPWLRACIWLCEAGTNSCSNDSTVRF